MVYFSRVYLVHSLIDLSYYKSGKFQLGLLSYLLLDFLLLSKIWLYQQVTS